MLPGTIPQAILPLGLCPLVTPPPPEPQKRTVRILLECFLVIHVLACICQTLLNESLNFARKNEGFVLFIKKVRFKDNLVLNHLSPWLSEV